MLIFASSDESDSRLHELGLTISLLHRVLLRADAETKLVSGFEPPTAEGWTRYSKTVGFLREEVVRLGWDYDNSKNFCRTIHPSRSFAIVTSSGDEFCGVDVPGKPPSTAYPKGAVTENVVQKNSVQLALDIGPQFNRSTSANPVPVERVWWLIQRVTVDQIFSELSLPIHIEGGTIDDWEQRIILPPISRDDTTPESPVEEPPADDDGYTVDVSML